MNPVTNAQGQAAESSSTSIKDASINAPNVNTTVSTTSTKAAVSTSPGKIGVCFDDPFFLLITGNSFNRWSICDKQYHSSTFG